MIGQGGMGVVLKAFDPALHRLVAIKVMAAAVAGSAIARQRFTREAKAAAAVCHEHIVAVHGVHEADGLPYLVMQYIAGESLQDRLVRIGPLEVVEVVRIGMQTALGLAAAHAQGLIHRDIKPANLLLEGEPGALQRLQELRQDHRLRPGPHDRRRGIDAERRGGRHPRIHGPRASAWRDGRSPRRPVQSGQRAVCHVYRRPPFRGSTTLAVLRQVSEQAPTPVQERNPDVPAWLETFIARLMAKDPADRFGSAAEVAELLEGCLAHLREPAMVSVPELPSPLADDGSRPARHGTVRKWPPRLGWMGLLLLVALGLSIFFLVQAAFPPEQPPPTKQPLAATVHQDFRGSRPLLPSLRLFGPDVETVARPEEGGLQIHAPGDAAGASARSGRDDVQPLGRFRGHRPLRVAVG